MELFKIFGSMVIDDKKAIESLSKTRQEAKKTQDAANLLGDAGKKIGTAFIAGSALVGTAALAITGKTVQVLDDIDKASQRAGMGAEEFQRWGHVANLNGIELSTFEKAAARNQKTMADASKGAGSAADAYKKLGINIEGMNSDQVFEEVILNLSEMDDETQRNAVANDIFGRSFADLAPLLNNTSEEIMLQKGELDELGAVMSGDSVKAGAELNDAFTRVQEMFGAVVLKIGTKLIPVFQSIMDWIMDNKDGIQEGFETALDAVSNAIDWVKQNADWLIPVLATMLGGFMAYKIIGIISGLFAALTTIIGGVSAAGGILNFVMAANPIGAVILAITAIIAIGVLLWKNWDTIIEWANKLWTNIKDKFSGIRTAITDNINKAKDAVGRAVDKIKGFFNFKWAFPKLKMPHFSVSGSMNPLKWVKQGVPKIGVDWYAKGGLMKTATAFGMSGDRIQAGGEKGPEAILPLTTNVLSNIGKGIASTMQPQSSNNITIADLYRLLSNLEFKLRDGGDTIVAIVDNRLIEVMG